MPKGNPEGYLTKDVGRITDATKAKVKKAMDVGRITDAAKAKVKKAKKEAKKAKDVGRITDKARKFVGVMGRFPGGRLSD
jgi:hypothetical protein